MTTVKFEDIQEAFDFVNFGSHGDHTALLDKSTGKIHWHSESAGEEAIPDALWESSGTVEIPRKSDLGLGNQLVFDFVQRVAQDDYEHVRDIFRRRGAYARYKDFLQSRDLLQSWYEYEGEETKRALMDWCRDNGVEVTG
jgi:hypothetical protein